MTACKHKWVSKRYKGIGVIVDWDVCTYCGKERNRTVYDKSTKKLLAENR